MKAAPFYAARGWRVVPLHDVTSGACSCGKPCGVGDEHFRHAGKHPRISDWVNEASNDPGQIAQWIASYPNANIGVATGTRSGFFVLDVDPDNGGPATLAALVEIHGALPDTLRARTGSGGTHFLFRCPEGQTVSNSSGTLGPGLDVRGEGGQIVVSPSVSAKGAYRWHPGAREIAPAPAWLLEMLRPRPVLIAAPSRERLVYPPATPEVIENAAAALTQHGAAIQGKGGDTHTWKAAAILANDFALTDEEAWPIFVEWNESCIPEWPEADLAAKLRGGLKYAGRPYGSGRASDSLTVVKGLIAAHRASGAGDVAVTALVKKIRVVCEACGDTVTRGLILAETRSATGLGVKDLDLPQPKNTAPPAPIGTNEVHFTPQLAEVADQATEKIADKLFVRNGILVDVAITETLFIQELEQAAIQDALSRHIKWTRDTPDGREEIAAPMPIAAILGARRTHKGLRVLEAITTAPVLLADGSILQREGYSAQARLYLHPDVAVLVPADPTQEEAAGAVTKLRDLVSDFPFLSEADFSSWLAGLLTPLCKSALNNAPAPLICVSAPTPAEGKSLLVKLACLIVAGRDPEIRSYNPKDPAEWGKRVTSYVKAASPISVFDNINGPFGDETIDRLITASTWSDRILGASEAPPIPIVSTWWATGNNIEPTGDTVRRSLMVRLVGKHERPQERTDLKIPEIEEYVKAHRSEYLSAALTILRGYCAADRPAQPIPVWGSFTAWSALVRGAIVWAGGADPFITQARASIELNETDHDVHDWWIKVVEGAVNGTPAEVCEQANERDAVGTLNIRSLVTTHSLRSLINKFVDRPRRGKRICRAIGAEETLFRVEAIK